MDWQPAILPHAKDIALLVSGVFWTVAYVEMIVIGRKVSGYAMPLIAICLNLSWELQYTALGFAHWPNIQAPINLVWLLLEFGILATFFRSPIISSLAHFAGPTGRRLGVMAMLTSCLILQGAFLYEFGLRAGAVYSAFLQNLVMSGLFLAYCISAKLFLQTFRMAVCRACGTFFACLAFGVFREFVFALIVGLLCFATDMTYIAFNRENWYVRSAMAGRS